MNPFIGVFDTAHINARVAIVVFLAKITVIKQIISSSQSQLIRLFELNLLFIVK